MMNYIEFIQSIVGEAQKSYPDLAIVLDGTRMMLMTIPDEGSATVEGMVRTDGNCNYPDKELFDLALAWIRWYRQSKEYDQKQSAIDAKKSEIISPFGRSNPNAT